MATYESTVAWERNGATFTDRKFSRAHTISFDGGITVPGSASPHVVKLPYSREDAVDPEEMLVAALSACHMLTFLYVAALQGFIVDNYRDNALGVMKRNAQGRLAITKVTLRPEIVFSGDKHPSPSELEALHHKAHEDCFIANSVTTEVVVEPVAQTA